ncbi:adenylate/guanylate cyclase domain-containing protein [Zavarzinia compransoris]|uniref:adenylate/guanylate cyclase domain-containing protein n=1 Tax=Zavarzinia marina TaxID=2911065 RepID=UPI001F40BF5C|nr:adenylate/guanylate cyclase domain-containing protein [Zavarzinia marina]MCF4166743.1 adenylate/guanylate cyclase domain-containing protein [Zavarzinia marina]
MARHLRLRPAPAIAGLLASALLLLAFPLFRPALEERVADLMLGLAAPDIGAPVAVVDIDAASIERIGPWPWRRSLIGDLVARAANAGAAAVGVDILFAEADTRSPAALARRLGDLVQNSDLAALADHLPDDDRHLAGAIAGRPVALGFVLGPATTAPPAGASILRRGRAGLGGLWRAPGAEGPAPDLAAAAVGIGTLALPGDADGITRRVPLFVAVGGEIRPGLALETLRLAQKASIFRVDTVAGRFAVGEAGGNLPPDAMLRLVPLPDPPPFRTLSAADLLDPAAEVPDLAGSIVFVGGSAPEMGGLRATAGSALMSSVAIQAAAAAQILGGFTPHRPALVDDNPLLLPVLGAVAGIAVALLLPPLAGAGAIVLLLAGFAGFSLRAAGGGLLLDPAGVLLVGASAYVATAILAFAGQHRRERRIRQRFEQHLAPQVVEMIARDPGMLKLTGQRREVTALFTDVAGFTALTHGAAPEDLVAALDAYFEGMSAIVIDHGGMIDKFVGDAIHAFFNAPLDQPGHPEAAVRCAVALSAWSEQFCRRDLPLSLGFGPTRIGIETGEVIVGDIGVRAKLDYTAHGDAVNTAARLEAANKDLGTRICVGPGTAARCPPGLLRPSGTIVPRGLETPIETFEPV